MRNDILSMNAPGEREGRAQQRRGGEEARDCALKDDPLLPLSFPFGFSIPRFFIFLPLLKISCALSSSPAPDLLFLFSFFLQRITFLSKGKWRVISWKRGSAENIWRKGGGGDDR